LINVGFVREIFKNPPEFIDIGGGYFGKMEESLKKQFGINLPSYQDYAKTIATKMQNAYGKMSSLEKPKLLLEPGTALVTDAMKFVVKVISVKIINKKIIATVSGSGFNIFPMSKKINLPIKVFCRNKKRYNKQYLTDLAGYTCIEDDFLYKGYKGYLAVGDYIVFDNVGSYSLVMKPPFILPNCAVVEYNPGKKAYDIIKREEKLKDIFNTFLK
jgi:diaminopimelate decarboxylase